MKYSIYSIYLTIFKMLYLIIFTNILATNDSGSNTNKNLHQHKYETLLEQVKDYNRTLIDIFPILNFVDGLCVQSGRKDYDGVDLLNAGKCKTIIYLNFKSSYLRKLSGYIRFLEFIEDLDLYDNMLRTDCFDIITLLPALRVLNIAYNSIKKIPKNILKLRKLENLVLGDNYPISIENHLYELKLITLELNNINVVSCTTKDEIRNRKNIFAVINKFLENRTLENFGVYDNDLSEFDFDNKKEYYLKRLTLYACKMSTLPDSFKKLKKLEYFDLTGNKFTIVPSILSGFESLKELNLEGNPIESYEKVSFHSLETLHIKWNREYNLNISISNTFSPLKHIHIDTVSPYYTGVSFESSTIKHLKGLYQYGRSILKISDHEDMKNNLEFLCTNGEFNTNNDMNIISKLKSLRKLHVRLRRNSRPEFMKKLFLALQNLENLESLVLEGSLFDHIVLYEDTTCYLENVKNLRIIQYYINYIECFNVVKNLKSIWFENVRYYQSNSHVNSFLNKNKIRVAYKNCTFDFKRD